jgi:hypothetical protein
MKYYPSWRLALAEFRVNLAESLCKVNESTKHGRPSNETNATIEAKRLKPTSKSLPTRDVRGDAIGLFPICKLPFCTGFSFIMCEKCDVFRCLNKARYCFNKFQNWFIFYVKINRAWFLAEKLVFFNTHVGIRKIWIEILDFWNKSIYIFDLVS